MLLSLCSWKFLNDVIYCVGITHWRELELLLSLPEDETNSEEEADEGATEGLDAIDHPSNCSSPHEDSALAKSAITCDLYNFPSSTTVSCDSFTLLTSTKCCVPEDEENTEICHQSNCQIHVLGSSDSASYSGVMPSLDEECDKYWSESVSEYFYNLNGTDSHPKVSKNLTKLCKEIDYFFYIMWRKYVRTNSHTNNLICKSRAYSL